MLGDWREEVITADATKLKELKVFSTWYPTDYKFPWLMTDHTYEMSALNQNAGYNQPTNTGYYLPDYPQATVHSISFETSGNGTVEADKKQADIDETVTLTVTPALGYKLTSLVVEATTDDDSDTPIMGAPRRTPTFVEIPLTKVDDTHYTFTMPAYDVTVTAIFQLDESIAKTFSVKKEWVTFCSPATYSVPEGLKAYTISSITLPNGTEDGTITLKEQTVIAKDVPMIIWNAGYATTTDFTIIATDDISIPAEDMCSEYKGSSAAATVLDATKGNYVLKNGSFIPTIASKISRYSCYLELAASSQAQAPRFNIMIGGGASSTGIRNIGTAKIEEGVWYNLNGVRMSKPAQKGIYIHHGKKIVIK